MVVGALTGWYIGLGIGTVVVVVLIVLVSIILSLLKKIQVQALAIDEALRRDRTQQDLVSKVQAVDKMVDQTAADAAEARDVLRRTNFPPKP